MQFNGLHDYFIHSKFIDTLTKLKIYDEKKQSFDDIFSDAIRYCINIGKTKV